MRQLLEVLRDLSLVLCGEILVGDITRLRLVPHHTLQLFDDIAECQFALKSVLAGQSKPALAERATCGAHFCGRIACIVAQVMANAFILARQPLQFLSQIRCFFAQFIFLFGNLVGIFRRWRVGNFRRGFLCLAILSWRFGLCLLLGLALAFPISRALALSLAARLGP